MESEDYEVPEDVRKVQERLAVNGSVSVIVIPRSKLSNKGNSPVNIAHSRKESKTLEVPVTSPNISEDSKEGNTLHHNVASRKPNVGTGHTDSSKDHPESKVRKPVVIRVGPRTHDKLMTTEPSHGLQTPADSHDSSASASGSSSDCNHTSGTPNAPKQMGVNRKQNVLHDTQQSQSAEQDLTDDTNLGNKSSLENKSKTKTESTDYHRDSLQSQKYNLREVIQTPVRFTSQYSKNTRSSVRGGQNNSNKKTCIKICLPSYGDVFENRLITVFSELGNLLECSVAVEKGTSYTTQQDPSEKSREKPQQYTKRAYPQPQFPTLHPSGHNLSQSSDRSDCKEKHPKVYIPTTSGSVNMRKRREPVSSVTKRNHSVFNDKNMSHGTRQTEDASSAQALSPEILALIPVVQMD